MKLKSSNRTTIGLIGVGIGFVVLPVLLHLFTTNPFLQLLTTVSVGVVYICIGLAIGGWYQRTQSKQVPFWVVGSTAGITILPLIGLELFVLRLSITSFLVSDHVSFGVVEQVVLSPHLLLGWTVALLIAADSASTRRQRVVPAAGITVVLLAFTVAILQYSYIYTDQQGYNASGMLLSVGLFVFFYILVVLLVAGFYTLPYYVCTDGNNKWPW